MKERAKSSDFVILYMKPNGLIYMSDNITMVYILAKTDNGVDMVYRKQKRMHIYNYIHKT